MAKITKKKKTEQPVIEPEVIGEVADTETEEFVTPSVNADFEGKVMGTLYTQPTFSVKLDTKKIEGLTEDRVLSLVHGSIPSVKKIVIEAE